MNRKISKRDFNEYTHPTRPETLEMMLKHSLQSANEIMTPYGEVDKILFTQATDFSLHYGTGYTGFVI